MTRIATWTGPPPTVQDVVLVLVHRDSPCATGVEPVLLDVPMSKPASLVEDGKETGFFNPTPGQDERRLDLLFKRVLSGERERFRLQEPMGYWDAELGGIIAPECLDGFESDFTSVPPLFTWLLARSGKHLPAALIHDALVNTGRDEDGFVVGQRSYVVSAPDPKHRHPVPRTQADRVFRDALRDLEIPWLRRWLTWTAVTAATYWQAEPTEDGRAVVEWRRRLAVASTLAVVLVLGALATVDLLGWRDWVWWMPEWGLGWELGGGAAGALAVPLFLSGLWGRQWRAGLIAGVALAFLLHVTVALFVVSSGYLAVENLMQRKVIDAAKWGVASLGTALVVWWFLAWAYPR